MARKLNGLSQRYVAALRKHLKQGPGTNSPLAQVLGRRAMALGLETLDLARFHEQALIALVLPDYSPGTRDRMIRRAGIFFAEAITPIEKTHRSAREANTHLQQMIQTLSQRTLDLAASNRQLKQEIAPAQGRGGIPQEQRAPLQRVAGAIAAHAGTIAASFPPASVRAGGRAQE